MNLSSAPKKLLTLAFAGLLLASGCNQGNDLQAIKQGKHSQAPAQTTSLGQGTPDAKAIEAAAREVDFTGPDLTIDGVYPSMKGPATGDLLALLPNSKSLAWLIGFKATIVQPDGKTAGSQEYMCHTNLNIASPGQHIQRDLHPRFNPGRLFTISQGQDTVELPTGFGVPILMGEPMSVALQALNLNGVPKHPFQVRHKLTFKFVEQSKLSAPLKPLFVNSVAGLKALDKNATHYAMDNPAECVGGGCLVGSSADQNGNFRDDNGNPFTGHWVVKPGRETNTTDVTKMLALPYDTTAHYFQAHVHPFCESIELYDVTADKSVVKLHMKQTPDKIGLFQTEHLSSAEGLPLYKDHKYTLTSVYNNTSGKDQDSMAVLTIFMLDKEFQPQKYIQPG